MSDRKNKLAKLSYNQKLIYHDICGRMKAVMNEFISNVQALTTQGYLSVDEERNIMVSVYTRMKPTMEVMSELEDLLQVKFAYDTGLGFGPSSVDDFLEKIMEGSETLSKIAKNQEVEPAHLEYNKKKTEEMKKESKMKVVKEEKQ